MKNSKQGFTLIELLVVIAIIGILAGVIVSSLSGGTDKAKTASAEITARSILTNIAQCSLDVNAGVASPVDVSNGGGNICVNSDSSPWPSIGTTGYVYNVTPKNNITDGNFSFTLTKNNSPTIYASLVGGAISLSATSISSGGSNAVSGTITYFNASSTPMHNVTVALVQNGTTMYSTITSSSGNGSYSFPAVAAGTYTVYFSLPTPVGSVNSTDAGQVTYWISAHPAIPWIRVLAMDTYQNSTSVNLTSQDSLSIQNFFVTSDTVWPAPPPPAYVFTKDSDGNTTTTSTSSPIPYAGASATPNFSTVTITVNGSDVVQNFIALAYGDINQSYTPSP